MRKLKIAVLALGLTAGLGVTVSAQPDLTTSLVRFFDTLRSGFLTLTPVTFSALGSSANGVIAYCSDCTIASPCAGSGTGALAKRLNDTWVCN